MTAGQQRDLMTVVEDRYGTGSADIASQLPVEAWHDVVDEPALAEATLDQVRHWSRTHGDAMAQSTTLIACARRPVAAQGARFGGGRGNIVIGARPAATASVMARARRRARLPSRRSRND
ncbi:ATP-binding protein [Mangrovicoccus ximenensis]|uniref:ATP-binding protein n=1 Tax=Mangrovicoccus ximenensis TaxID=1911570 RepID=UPI0022AAD719|nr:ATP-binding protein [Mangrovicoccus ximenensis]